MKDLRDIAEKHNLTYIETTSASNGYPQNIKGAVVGFNTFDQAKELAEKYNLMIYSFHKRNGWSLWHRLNEVCEPYYNTSEDYGDNYDELCQISEEDFFEDQIKYELQELESIDEVEKFLKVKKELWEEVENLDDDEIIITYLGSYYETVKKKSMSWYYDTHTYIIGLVKI